jgi:hypothetical protein
MFGLIQYFKIFLHKQWKLCRAKFATKLEAILCIVVCRCHLKATRSGR